MSEVLAPDFYRYEWTPLVAAETDGRFVCLRWADGIELRVFDLWLRENFVGPGGVNADTREGTVDPADLTDDIHMRRAEVAADGSLSVRFEPGDIAARYHPGWLHHIALGQQHATSWLPEPEPWTTAKLTEPPTRDGRDILTDDEVLRHWVNDLLCHGIARLENLPTDLDFGIRLGARIGAIRETNFGAVWDVRADVELDGDPTKNSNANTRQRLAPHTDLPTRETPPGFQFLHCIVNTTTGGFSTMADGAAVAAHIEEHHPEDFEALSTLRWIFFNRGRGLDHRWSGPIIDLGVAGSPLTLRAFYPLKAFPDMDEGDIPRAYRAARRFSQVAADDRFQMRYPFRPGDLVGFDNRRILHGRDAYESNGHRHLRGFYMDHDEIRSFARVANRRAVPEDHG
jgi:gamma-butyrobetaine dioxygenase